MTHPKRYVDVLRDVQKSKALGAIPAMRGNARAILQFLASHAHRDTRNEELYRKCFPKQSTIADELGISERTVIHEIRVLVKAGLLRREKQRGNRYVYEIPELWELVELASGGKVHMNGHRRMEAADLERVTEQTNLNPASPYLTGSGVQVQTGSGVQVTDDPLYIEGSKMSLEREGDLSPEREGGNDENSPDDIWQQALGELQLKLPEATFETWLRDTTLIDCTGDKFIIGTPHAYARDWLQNRIHGKVTRVLGQLTKRTVQVDFEVRPLM